MNDPTLTRRTPDAVFMACASVLTGAGQVLANRVAGSVDQLVGDRLGLLWSASLFGFGAVLLLGLVWRTPTTGILLERAGRWGLSGACLAYSVAAFALAGMRGAFPAVVVAAFGTASLVRGIQITRWERKVRRGR